MGDVKCTVPVDVLFEGYDEDIFKPTDDFTKELADKLSVVKEDFCFLYVGHWLQGNLGHDRKDTGMLVKVFLETFKDMKIKPGLIMKSSGATFSLLDREDMLNRIKADPAVASGPFVTASNDILSLLIYYGVAIALVVLHVN